MANSFNVANINSKDDFGQIYFYPFIRIPQNIIILSSAVINIDVYDDGNYADDYDFSLIGINQYDSDPWIAS